MCQWKWGGSTEPDDRKHLWSKCLRLRVSWSNTITRVTGYYPVTEPSPPTAGRSRTPTPLGSVISVGGCIRVSRSGASAANERGGPTVTAVPCRCIRDRSLRRVGVRVAGTVTVPVGIRTVGVRVAGTVTVPVGIRTDFSHLDNGAGYLQLRYLRESVIREEKF